MFYLYSLNERTLLKQSMFELEILNTIGEYMEETLDERFLIVEKTPKGDNTRGYIRGFDDYIKYRENYELRQKSCQELKKEITKDVKIKKKIY